MPYIKEEARERLKTTNTPMDAGELNYAVTKLVDEYVRDKGLTYKNLNEAIGVLECAKLEFYRRICATYEHRKMIENKDVYTNTLG